MPASDGKVVIKINPRDAYEQRINIILILTNWNTLRKVYIKIIKELIDHCIIIDINEEIKYIVIELKKKHHFKLPDAIIIATALYLDLPLITADQDFRKADTLNLIFYER